MASPRKEIFFVYNISTGVPLSGAAAGMSFSSYVKDDGSAVTQPAITEIAAGIYGFTPVFADATHGIAYVLSTGATGNPSYVARYMRPEDWNADDVPTVLTDVIANGTAIAAVQTTVNAGATAAALATVATAVGTKASQTSVDAVQTTVNAGATAAALATLSTAVGTKASQTSVDAVQTTVNLGATAAALATVATSVGTRATSSEVAALQADVDTANAGIVALQGDVDTVVLQAAAIRAFNEGRCKIHTTGPDANRLVVYDVDGVSVLAKFDLFDASGSPSTSSPFERVPV